MATAAASAKLDWTEKVLAAPVNGVPVGAGGIAVVPVAARVAFALVMLPEPVPVTIGGTIDVDVAVVVVRGAVVEARTTVLKMVDVEVEVMVVCVVDCALVIAAPNAATERKVLKRILKVVSFDDSK